LREKFQGDIHRLNAAYGTAFWSQEYNDFDEIPTPLPTITTHNPALRLDWERYRAHVITRYMDFQVGLLRELDPDTPVLHDFPGGGLRGRVNYDQIAKNLDIVAYNNYPVWGGQREPLPPHEIAFALDHIRGLKGKFWVTEAILGAQGHEITGFLPRPGQAKLWSYQAMARGCESLLYFRYRGATRGAEQFCYGVVNADDRKGRRFQEAQSFFREIRQYAPQLTAPIKAQAAFLYDFDALASLRIQRQSTLLDPVEEAQRLYKYLYDQNLPVDILPADRDLTGYRLAVLPLLTVTDPELVQRCEAFVRSGGILVLTYRTAVKDRDNNLVLGEKLPVGFTDLTGAFVEETESLQEREVFPLVGEGDFRDKSGRGGVFRDLLTPETAQVLYRYGDQFYRDYAAVTRNAYGAGAVYYIGCSPDDETVEAIMAHVCREAGLVGVPSPDGVEVAVRGEPGDQIRLVLNHNDHEVDFEGETLAPFACRVGRWQP
jgi:beta-galactosidase